MEIFHRGANTSIIINGRPPGKIYPSPEIRQGDPSQLSYLFWFMIALVTFWTIVPIWILLGGDPSDWYILFLFELLYNLFMTPFCFRLWMGLF